MELNQVKHCCLELFLVLYYQMILKVLSFYILYYEKQLIDEEKISRNNNK